MNYKETLFFIGKCLTITHDEKNREYVSQKIKSGKIDWEAIVKVSTSHFVFPALYCNLLRTELLSNLPSDLIAFMEHISTLNRERNQQIIDQAKEINELLLKHSVTPIFLKGTGNLLEGLYEDIAERMIGDIDFLVAPDEYKKTIEVLEQSGYQKRYDQKHDTPEKHYPRLIKEEKIAAVEIHKHMLKDPYQSEFDYDKVQNSIMERDSISFLGYNHQLCLAIIAKQINDDGQYFKTMSLRNAYDVYLLSQKVDPSTSIKDTGSLFHPLNNFLALCSEVLSDKIKYQKTDSSKKYIAFFQKLLSDKKFRDRHLKRWNRKLFIRERLSIILKSFYDKRYRRWLLQILTNKKWYPKN